MSNNRRGIKSQATVFAKLGTQMTHVVDPKVSTVLSTLFLSLKKKITLLGKYFLQDSCFYANMTSYLYARGLCISATTNCSLLPSLTVPLLSAWMVHEQFHLIFYQTGTDSVYLFLPFSRPGLRENESFVAIPHDPDLNLHACLCCPCYPIPQDGK